MSYCAQCSHNVVFTATLNAKMCTVGYRIWMNSFDRTDSCGWKLLYIWEHRSLMGATGIQVHILKKNHCIRCSGTLFLNSAPHRHPEKHWNDIPVQGGTPQPSEKKNPSWESKIIFSMTGIPWHALQSSNPPKVNLYLHTNLHKR